MSNDRLSSAENLMPEGLYSDMEKPDEVKKSEEMLRILFQKAYYEYHPDELFPRKSPDFSFIEDDNTAGRSENESRQKDIQPVKHHFIMPRAAAVLLAGFVLFSGMAYLWNSQFAYAARFQLEKAIYQISGNYSTSDQDLNRRNDTISISIGSMEDIDKAVRFMPDLFVPSFIPDGWELDRLELMKTLQGDFTAEYVFLSGAAGQFRINEVLAKDAVVTDFMESRQIGLQNRTVKYMTDPYTLLHCVQFSENDCLVTLSGDLKDDELFNVADNMIQNSN